jgi:uroporphyrinogen-III synthase
MLNFPAWPGLRVLNTRPANQAQPLSNALRNAGAMPIELPLLYIEPTHITCHLTDVHQLLFISPNAVHLFFKSIANWSIPPHVQLTCMGPGTAAALTQYLPHHAQYPHITTSEQLLKLPHLQQIKNQTIGLIKGEQGRTVIEDTLKQRGAHLQIMTVYKRIPIDYPKKDLEALWRDNGLDMILITSQDALDHLFDLFTEAAHPWLCSKLFLVLSPRLAEAAKRCGVQHLLICSMHELMSALQQSITKE